METKANTTLIGAFTLVVIATLIAFTGWISKGGKQTERADYLVYFYGPVSGLLTGGTVLFNGIKVGEVKTVSFNPSDPKQVIASISIDANAPIHSDADVTLDTQGLTGITAISIRGGETNTPRLRPEPGRPEILYARSSGVQDLIAAARDIMGRTDTIMRRVDKFVEENDKTITQAARNIENFTAALNKNSNNIDNFLSETGGAAERISELSNRLIVVAERVDKMIATIEPQQFGSIVRNVDKLTGNLAKDSDTVAALIADVRKAIQSFDDAMGPLASLGRAIDSVKISNILENVDRFSTTLAQNSPAVDQIVKDASAVSEKLNSVAQKVDKLVSDFAGNGTTSMFGDFSEAAKSIKSLAEKLDKRTADLSSTFSGFSDKTMRELQALSSDGRRALSELDRTLKSLEKNPQRLLFGGPSVPEYNRRQ